MIKRSKWLSVMLGAFVLIASGISLACKSTPSVSEVDPLDLLDSRSAFYIRIPKDVDSKLISRMLQNNLDGLSDADAQKVAERIDTVYLGLKKSKRNSAK